MQSPHNSSVGVSNIFVADDIFKAYLFIITFFSLLSKNSD